MVAGSILVLATAVIGSAVPLRPPHGGIDVDQVQCRPPPTHWWSKKRSDRVFVLPWTGRRETLTLETTGLPPCGGDLEAARGRGSHPGGKVR